MSNVVFGSGPLAWWVMQTLLERGKEVSMVSRSGKTDRQLPAGVKLLACDLNDAEAVAQACLGAKQLYFCAMPPYTRWPEEFPGMVTGFLQGAKASGADIVYGDNLYMYGPTDGKVLTEDLGYHAPGHKGKVRAAMADLFMEAHSSGQQRVTMGRVSDFYGPEVVNAMFGEDFFKAALTGKTANLVGDPDQPHTYSYIKDFARGLVTLGEQDAAFGESWHIPAAPTLTTRELVGIIEEELGGSVRFRTAGKGMISFLGLFNPMIKEVKEMLYTSTAPYVVDHSKFERVFDLEVTSHEQAISETLRWYEERLKAAN